MSQNKAEFALHVDIPVMLEKANVVFNMDHLVFAGDMPVGINYMRLLANRFREMIPRDRLWASFTVMQLT
jgi:hypothetical protein